MREIKFRAWDTVEKKMKLPTLLRLSRGLPYTDDNNNGKVFQMQCNGQENVEYFNGRIELMQYTGLKDKNGKEIYEGDIVTFEDAECDAEGYHDNVFLNRGVVFYDEISMCYSFTNRQTIDMDDLYIPDDVEVIGNIYDNPELLVKT